MTNYNADTIVKIKTLDSVVSKRYKYKTEKRIFGIKIRNEGFYWDSINEYYDECPVGYMLVDDVVYTKPECEITFVDGTKISIFFDSYLEAVEYKQKIVSKGNYI